jgi:arylsulfatase A-like enzyme
MDDGFGALVADLRRRGIYDRALIVVTADHGEGFGSHDYYEHVRSLYAELIHVPLLVKFPQQWHAGTVVAAAARQVDILPTVLDALGAAPPPDIDGTSLLPALSCPDAPAPPAYSAVGGLEITPQIESLIVGRHKLIHSTRTERARPRLELYDLAADPDEQHDLAPTQPVLAGYLFSRLAPYHAASSAGPAQTVKPDAAIAERMRALGS